MWVGSKSLTIIGEVTGKCNTFRKLQVMRSSLLSLALPPLLQRSVVATGTRECCIFVGGELECGGRADSSDKSSVLSRPLYRFRIGQIPR